MTAIDGTFESIAYRIVRKETVTYGSVTLIFSVETPLGVIDCQLAEPEGKPRFVATRCVVDKYGGDRRRTMRLDPRFAEELLARITAPESNDTGPVK